MTNLNKMRIQEKFARSCNSKTERLFFFLINIPVLKGAKIILFDVIKEYNEFKLDL